MVCIHPKRTIREILDYHSGLGVLGLVFSFSLLDALNPSYTAGFISQGNPLPMALGKALAFALVCNSVLFLFSSFFFYLIGKALHRESNFIDACTASAWTYPPFVIASLVLNASMIVYWRGILSKLSIAEMNAMNLPWQGIFIIGILVIIVWGLIIAIAVSAEYLEISNGKSFLVLILFLILGFFEAKWLENFFPFLFQLASYS